MYSVLLVHKNWNPKCRNPSELFDMKFNIHVFITDREQSLRRPAASLWRVTTRRISPLTSGKEPGGPSHTKDAQINTVHQHILHIPLHYVKTFSEKIYWGTFVARSAPATQLQQQLHRIGWKLEFGWFQPQVAVKKYCWHPCAVFFCHLSLLQWLMVCRSF